jgi:hypothetical protein
MPRWTPSLLALAAAVLLAACGAHAAPPGERPALSEPGDPWFAAQRGSDAGQEDSGAGASDCGPDPGALTLAGMLTELVDLAHLARLPAVPYTSHLASSHNPRSDLARPGEPDWFADQDFLRLVPDQEHVLLDVEGPGVITRIWSASPGGVLRVYVDGAAQPVIEANLRELLSGAVQPFGAPFAFVAAYGHNLYFPIPFSSGCRVTLTGSVEHVVYYHLTYRRYPSGTEVEPYGEDALRAAECVRERVADRLAELRPDTLAVEGGERHRAELRSAEGPRGAAIIAAPAGGGMLRQLRFSRVPTDPERLRAIALVLAFDGNETVRAPLSEFFATGVGAGQVNSLPVARSAGGALTSRWPMPFASEARIWLEGTGAGEIEASLEAVLTKEPWSERSLLLHARWRGPETFASKPAHDWPLATIRGRGHYVGNTLNIVNRSRGWWGEGDEKIWVDGEDFPSHFGTGTEDYYGYAWCSNERFTTAYIGQTASTHRESFGRASLYRFHVLDPIPFRSELRFDLEVRHWGAPVDVTYDSLSVWYARPGSQAILVAPSPADFRIPALGVEEPRDVPEGPYRCGG